MILFFLINLLKKWTHSSSSMPCHQSLTSFALLTLSCLSWYVDIVCLSSYPLSTFSTCQCALEGWPLWSSSAGFATCLALWLVCGWVWSMGTPAGGWRVDGWGQGPHSPYSLVQDCRLGSASSYTKALEVHCMSLSFSTAIALSGFW